MNCSRLPVAALLGLLVTITAAQLSSGGQDLSQEPWANSSSQSIVWQNFAQYNIPFNQLGATTFALLYSLPLVAFMNTFRGPIGLRALGTNGFFTNGKASTAADRTVVRPNVDTIYGISIVDLSGGDVVVNVPEMQSDRFYLFSFYDPFGDNYASVGSVKNNTAGRYLLRPALNTGTSGISASNCSSQYQKCIDSPTMFGLMLARIEFKNNGSDVQYVNQYLHSVNISVPDKRLSTSSLSVQDLSNLPNDKPSQALTLAARLLERNPPQDQWLAYMLPQVLKYAGIVNGQYNAPAGINVTEAYSMANSTMSQFQSSQLNNVPLNNDWNVLGPWYSGSFVNGSDIIARSYVGAVAFLQNTPDQAIYPTQSTLGGAASLSDNEAYMFTFSSKPPVESGKGFWSLTIYDSDGFLVENPQNVYALGDRNLNMTYSDGQTVYGPANTGRDGSFQILVQPSNVNPPKNWTSNWLPSPAGGAPFELTLRLYAPESAAQPGGNYQYPKVEKVAAIKSS